MREVKIEIPDAWITENNVLFVIPSLYGNWVKMATDANKILAEWDYPIELNATTFQSNAVHRWVDPKVITDEIWPTFGYSTEPVDGWVRVYRIDLDNLSADVEIGSQP